ncbi:MAG: ECF-type sigma factor [Planctomycetota bacterium]|nr:ECF-type sigma factor [Planctomycetota bacterium]
MQQPEHPDEQSVRMANAWFGELYGSLRRLASWHLRGRSIGLTLQATAVVHDAYVRLVGSRAAQRGWSSREHFFNAAALAMRRVVLDWARSHGRRPRIQHLSEMSNESIPFLREFRVDQIKPMLAAIERLESEHPRSAKVAGYRLFVGLTVAEIAELLGLSTRTIDGDWEFARRWLRTELDEHA